jgi:hypothetical protein
MWAAQARLQRGNRNMRSVRNGRVAQAGAITVATDRVP